MALRGTGETPFSQQPASLPDRGGPDPGGENRASPSALIRVPRRSRQVVTGPGIRVGLLRITLRLPYARSRKDRRSVVRSLSDRMRARCLVAVAETGDPEMLREAEVSVVALGLGDKVVRARLETARNIAVRAYPSEVADTSIEWLNVPEEE